MARERTAADSTTGSDGASGGGSLLDRGSYRRLADAAVSTVAETAEDTGATDTGTTDAAETTDALGSGAASGDD